MELTHFGHSCLLASLGGTRVLFDPGTFAHGFEGVTGLDAIAITHQHPDHVDQSRLPALLDGNPNAVLLADPQTAAQLGEPWRALRPGESVELGAARIRGTGGRHAVIHPDIPVVDNTAYLFGTDERPNALLHPGDSLYIPFVPIEVLAMPSAAPWMTVGAGVDYLRAVAPRVAVPIHQGIIADRATGIFYGRYSEMAPPETEFVVLDHEKSADFAP